MAATLTYEYSVRDRTGKIVTGKLEAESQAAVVAQAEAAWATRRSASAQHNAGMKKEIKIPGFGSKVKLKDLAVMSRQFATMINSGLSLLRALTILAEQTENKELGRGPRRGPQRRRDRQRAVGGAGQAPRGRSRR